LPFSLSYYVWCLSNVLHANNTNEIRHASIEQDKKKPIFKYPENTKVLPFLNKTRSQNNQKIANKNPFLSLIPDINTCMIEISFIPRQV